MGPTHTRTASRATLIVMAEVDLVDETFIALNRASVARAFRNDPTLVDRWWPDLDLSVFMDRGDAGVRWSMTGALVGSCEIWLEEVLDGTLVHFYLRGAPSDESGRVAVPLPDDPRGWRKAARLRSQRAKRWKADIWAFKDSLEGARAAGAPAPSP